ncbi:MAG: hypothetical protein HKN82_04950, partial [Akkermansiaceae bacterium]|nr:hypothetical protein [Akkermansiaceae bacterium]
MGWERPFLPVLVEWLLARREELPGTLVVVPTAQAGRRLREAMAEAGPSGGAGRGGVLGPRVVTPAFFLQSDGVAPHAVELTAWVEVLEGVDDWGEFAAVFPEAPGDGEARGWALPLARSLADLRGMVQEGGLTVAMAAGRFGDGIEADRWQALAGLERRVERLLRDWGWRSKSTALADDPM